jgi:Tol biopolymer transport system component
MISGMMNNRSTRKGSGVKMVCLVALMVIAAVATGLSQNSAIVWSALDMGFARSTSGSSASKSVAGQLIVGTTQQAATRIQSGFLVGVPADSSSTGTGVIVYSRSGASGRTIWMRATDGSFDTMVISGGSWPRLSHNGRYILFHKGNGDPVFSDLFIYDLQTRRDTMLFNLVAHLICYDWFDDDYHIVFDHACGIYMKNRDLTGFTTLYQVDCYDDAPVARPGSWAIAHHNSFAGGIVVTDSLGVNRHYLANTGAGDFWPSWSRDGQWIAFMRRLNDTTYNYYKIHPDSTGSGLTALTAFTTTRATFDGGGAWTPDGSKIIVAAHINGVQGIYAIATDGSRGIGLVQTAAGDPIDFVGSVTGNVNIQLTDIHEEGKGIPSRFELLQNYPNPFNPATTIEYGLPSAFRVELRLYDILGREVTTLVNEVQTAGYHSVRFDASGLASGVYFYRLRAGEFTQTKRMVLMR